MLYRQNDNYTNSYQTFKIQHNCKHIKMNKIPPLCSMQNKNMCVTGQKNYCSSLLIAGLLHAEWVECKLHKFLPNLKIKQNQFHKHQICISNCKNHQNVSNPPTALCSMENDIKCVTGQENWCSSLLIAGLLHAQWAERTVMTWFNLTTATIHINGLSPNFLLTHHYEFKAFLKVNSSIH